MSFPNPQTPIENSKRHYDKFGFLVSGDQGAREAEYGNKSRFRRASPNFGRSRESPRFSPSRRDYRPERNERERRRRRSDYSPDFSEDRASKRDDRMDFDSWETPYNQPPSFVTAPPAPTYSDEPPPTSYSVPTAYRQFNLVPYGNFPEAPAAPGLDLGQNMGAPAAPPAPSIQQSTWTPTAPVLTTPQDDKVKREAIASEMRNQRATLAKQKEEYLKKAAVLKRELESLKQQRVELRGDSRRSPSPDSQRFLKENAKLQIEIQNKVKTINNVIDMLNGIIGDNPSSGETVDKSKTRKPGQPRTPTQSPPSSRSSSVESEKRSSSRNKRKSRSKSRTKFGDKKFNYVFYDPEMHWCRVCNEFPATAKEYLNHLHSPGHHRNALAHLEAPWHDVTTNQNEGMPSYAGAPSKRTPIKGLQFFVPSTAWYCKLCDQWIGDLHCASAHLKSLIHSQNYANFTELNPHWEMDWMSDRQKNFEKVHKTGDGSGVTEQKALYSPHTISFQPDGFHTKRKKGASPQLDKNALQQKLDEKKDKKKDKKKGKKKKRSSSESSSSSSSSNGSRDDRKKRKSNKDGEDSKGASQSLCENRDPAADDRMLSQWMSLKQDTLTDQDKKILEKLKNRVKSRAGEKVEQKVDGRVVSREREAREVLTIQGDKSRSDLHPRKEKDDKMKSKDRSNRERDYDREIDSKRHSDFKPYPGRREKQDHNEERFDKQVVEKARKPAAGTTSVADSKKMPFIGKMPLFKSLSNKPSKPESESGKHGGEAQQCVEAAKKKRDEINAQIQKSVEEMKEKLKTSLAMKDGSLPAPGLALPTTLGGQCPPPVIIEPSSHKILQPVSYPQTIHKIQRSPSTVVSEPAQLPTTKADNKTSQSQAAKNESLHKDFQDALDIIFPSENAPKKDDGSKHDGAADSGINLMTQIPPPSMSQGYPHMMPPHSYPMGPNHMGPMGPMGPTSMGSMGPNNMGPMGTNNMGPMGPMGPGNMGPMGPGNMGPMGPMGPNNMGMGPMGPPPMNMMGMPPGMMGWDYSGGMYPQGGLYDLPPTQSIPNNNASSSKGRHEQEDLAMLGIDAEDVGASGF